MNNFLSLNHLCELYGKYVSELSTDRFQQMYLGPTDELDGAGCHIDGELIYLLIRDLQLKHAIELSFGSCYSAAFIHEGLKNNGSDFTFGTWDIDRTEVANDRAVKFGFIKYMWHEDGIHRIPHYIINNNLAGKIDFLHIDSDHSSGFALKYLSHIWPLLSPQCLIFIHDMAYNLADGETINQWGPVYPLKITGTAFSKGEAEALRNFFMKPENDYCIYSTHKLFGQGHDSSPVLPLNGVLCEGIKKVYPKFTFPAAAIYGGLPRAPMSLIVLKTPFWAAIEYSLERNGSNNEN